MDLQKIIGDIFYRSGFKYQLTQNFVTTLPFSFYEDSIKMGPYVWLQKFEAGTYLSVYAGYAWDGPSGPTIDTKSFMRGSLVHDVLYEAMRKCLIPSFDYRKKADKLLRDMCIEDGMWKWRAEYVYRAVRRAGGPSADPSNRKKIHKAP